MNRISAITDPNGRGLVGINLSDHVDAQVLAANVAESHTIPAGTNYVLFSATADFYVHFTGTAAVPAADVTDGTASMLNPLLRAIRGATTISLISPVACIVIMEFYE